jgi:hypothetical protein
MTRRSHLAAVPPIADALVPGLAPVRGAARPYAAPATRLVESATAP